MKTLMTVHLSLAEVRNICEEHCREHNSYISINAERAGFNLARTATDPKETLVEMSFWNPAENSET
jgi:hypothetical protein